MPAKIESEPPLYVVTITLQDLAGGDINVSMKFAPGITEKTPTTPALQAAMRVFEVLQEGDE